LYFHRVREAIAAKIIGFYRLQTGTYRVSSVTDMDHMFDKAASFKQPLGNWNASSVTGMESMFGITSSFDQPLADWYLSSVVGMHSLFDKAMSFNQPVGNWKVSSVQSTDFMFNQVASFNQPLEDWDVLSARKMSYMFLMAQRCFISRLEIGTCLVWRTWTPCLFLVVAREQRDRSHVSIIFKYLIDLILSKLY
jgi:hypothetical protein